MASIRAGGRARPSRTEGTKGGGTVAPDGRAGAAVRDQGAGTAPPGPILTTRRGRAAQPERQQRPQPRGVQGGHLLGRLLLRRRRLGRSTWRGGPNRGAPTFSCPPPALVAPGLALAPKLRLDASTPRTRVSRARDAASAAARSSALTFSSVQSRVSFRLGRLLPPQTPPPVAQAGPPPAAPRGFPQEEAPAEPRAEGSTTSPQPRPPARPGPRRVPTRLNAFGAGAPRRARPLPTAVGVRTLNFRR